MRFGRARRLDDDRFDPDIAGTWLDVDRPSPIATRALQLHRADLIERDTFPFATNGAAKKAP